MTRLILNEQELSDALGTLDGWKAEGPILKKHYKFENFAAALAFVNSVGELADAADHHPDITFGWGYAEIALTTHDRGGITAFDTDLAGKIEAIAR